mmetsp:Transcript_11584/g.32223  ORF Transcript_11584/g.32223 Transcript_11584/m.32223 type:complete len:217 (+) Transcript_11584:2678-3328(+)
MGLPAGSVILPLKYRVKPIIHAISMHPSMENSPSTSISQRVAAFPQGPTSPKPVITTTLAGSIMLPRRNFSRTSAAGTCGNKKRCPGTARGFTISDCLESAAFFSEPNLSMSLSDFWSLCIALLVLLCAARPARICAVFPARSTSTSMPPVSFATTGCSCAMATTSGCNNPIKLKDISATVNVRMPRSSTPIVTWLFAFMRPVPRVQPISAPTMAM